VIVVDCCSQDDSLDVARASASARVIALDSNIGFGAACNRGIASATTPVIALVNPDVELIDDSLLALTAEAMRRDQPERLLAPLVLDPDGTPQDSVHPTPTTSVDLLRSLVPPSLLPGRLGTATAPWRARAPRPVGWAVGCALVAQTQTFQRLGMFDERFFMFGEDLEFGLRAAQRGIRTWFWPRARVIHARSHSTATAYDGEPFELLARARHVAVERRLGAHRAAVDDLAQTLTFASRGMIKQALGRSGRRERRQLEAVLSQWRARRASVPPAANERS
jgi:GT2 family glycosyltransferase